MVRCKVKMGQEVVVTIALLKGRTFRQTDWMILSTKDLPRLAKPSIMKP